MTTQYISDEEIGTVFQNTNFVDGTGTKHFGGGTPEFRRKLLAQGVLKHLVPFRSGHTLTCIMKELGLIAMHGKREDVYVTALGRKFLYAEYYNEGFDG